MTRAVWPVALAVALLALAGCGGGGHTSSVSSTSTTAPSGRLAETVRNVDSTKTGSDVVAQPGNPVLLKTSIGGRDSSSPQTVTLSADTGPANTLRITAASAGHKSSAQIHGSGGKHLTLTQLRYSCTLPPAATFCPAQSTSSSTHGVKLTFSAGPRTGIVVSAVVGPVPGPKPRPSEPGGLPTTAYVPTELVQARAGPGAATTSSTTSGTTAASVSTTTSVAAAPQVSTTTAGSGATAGPLPATSAIASPGDRVTMITRLAGLPHGLPQQTTITVQKGPAKALAVSASVPAAPTSKATITGAGGAKISLAPPRFSCAVAPVPTFCPPTKLENQRHRWRLTFSASPHSPPIVLVTLARGS